jgi:hypothetical protein
MTIDWNLVLAICTALMAAGTVYLAWETRKLANDATEGTKQADRHHQENLRPFCVIIFPGASDLHPFGDEFDAQVEWFSPGRTSQPEKIWVRGDVKNKGKGLAKDVLIYFNMRRGEGEAGAYRLTRPVVVSSLIGAEETIEIDIGITERDVMHAWVGNRLQPTQVFSAVANDTYEIVLEYKDVFGNIFRTVHPRGIWENALIPDVGSEAKRSELMIRQNKPTPIFLSGRQAVRTLADLPPMPVAPAEPDPSTGAA